MTYTVKNTAGDSVQLSESPFAQGGEAAIYAIPKFPDVVVKFYHPQILQQRGTALRTKIEAMTSDPKLARFKHHTNLAWPRFSVFDEQQQWRGYAMKKAEGVRMTVLAHAMAYREHFPDLDRFALTAYLLHLLETVNELHAAGVMIGDFNPANFLCNPQKQSTTLIDCDSWQVNALGKRFNCPVAAPDMLPPELLGKSLENTPRTLESERFALAILMFKVLMLGRHPFDAVGGESPVENIRKGYFPYGLGGGGIPKGAWFNIWSHLSFNLKEQFVRTFKEGGQKIDERTTIQDWIRLFKLYQKEMGRGFHDKEIKPVSPKTNQYRGNRSIPQSIAA